MALNVIYSHRGSCVYQCCENGGHTVCRAFGDYYTRLVAAAQALVDEPTEDHMTQLAGILAEEDHGVENG